MDDMINTIRPENRDIPDMEAKAPPTIELPADVQAEREVRRYINKEGVFCKDIEQLFAVAKGIDSAGKMQYQQTKTRGEAEKIVTVLLEKTGRKVSRDSLSDRLKATPGWNLAIRVPGMQQSEQKAAAESDAHLQARTNQQQILDVRKENEDLRAQLTAVNEKIAALSTPKADPEPEPEKPVKGKGGK